MDVKETIQKSLQDVLEELGLESVSFTLESPTDASHGDFATNFALVASKLAKKSPIDLAEEMKRSLEAKNLDNIEKIEVVRPGFINFFLSENALLKNLASVLQSEKKEGYLSGKTIMVEFTDPNPFKELHIGHLYSNIVGESLARLMESQGAKVYRVCYQGDVGLHVAKAVFGMKHKLAGESLESIDAKPLFEKAKWLGEAYALGAQAYEELPEAKDEIVALNKKIFAKDPEVMPLYVKGKEWSLAYFETQYQRLGTKFDHYFFESEVADTGIEQVKNNMGRVFVESEGAIVFKGEDHGLHTRVFINSLGLPVYEAKELGLAIAKKAYQEVDASIVVTANEITEYYKVVMKALSLIDPGLAARIKHITHGFVRLPEGKMSSRTGNVLTAEWLLNQGKEVAEEKIAEQTESETLDAEEADKISEMVGTGAIKYALLKQGLGKDIAFSFKESVSFDGNAGPYLQYTYVRTRSVLSKSQTPNTKSQNWSLELGNLDLNSEELTILRLLTKYAQKVEEAARKYSPHVVAGYLYDLATAFNLFYQKHQILKAEENVKHFRLALSQAVGEVMKEGLNLLGVQTPERM